jgi:hypothetical protein
MEQEIINQQNTNNDENCKNVQKPTATGITYVCCSMQFF